MDALVRVAIAPHDIDAIHDAVVDVGGVIAEPIDADAVVWTDPFDPDALRLLLESSPARWVQLPFAGIEKFVEAGVVDAERVWTCAKGIYGPTCAELALALVLAGARHVHRHARRTSWWKSGDEPMTHRRLRGATVLVVGTGGIGRAFAQMIGPLGARIVAVNRSGNPMPGADTTSAMSGLRDLVSEADHIVIAAALTPETYRMIDAEVLARMKPEAWIVNVARGGLIDTDALVAALRAGTIGGAGLDVTDPEPLPAGHALWSMPNVIITSHTANTWAMALPELGDLVRRNVKRFANGESLEGIVDPELGY